MLEKLPHAKYDAEADGDENYETNPAGAFRHDVLFPSMKSFSWQQIQSGLDDDRPYPRVLGVDGGEVMNFAVRCAESAINVETEHWLLVLQEEPVARAVKIVSRPKNAVNSEAF